MNTRKPTTVTESPTKHGKVMVQSKSVDTLNRVKLPRSIQKIPRAAQLSSLQSFDSFEDSDYIEYVRQVYVFNYCYCINNNLQFISRVKLYCRVLKK